MLKLAVAAIGLAVAPLLAPCQTQATRTPRLAEVSLSVRQYATGAHALNVRCDGVAPRRLELAVSRRFVYRVEPRWRGGATGLDVISQVHIAENGLGQWSSIVHHGALRGNRELGQINQTITSGAGGDFEPAVGHPEEYRFAVDFQLGRQDGPKRICRAAVRVWNAADPRVPAGAHRA
jgi:hypothetical protein